jgi:hypothetical protein
VIWIELGLDRVKQQRHQKLMDKFTLNGRFQITFDVVTFTADWPGMTG